MEYRKKKSALMKENLMIVMLAAFLFIVTSWLLRGLMAYILFLLVRDQIVTRNFCFKTSEDGFCEIKGNKEKCFKYSEIEYVTINRKFKRYVAVGKGDQFVLVRNDVENRIQLVNHIIEQSKGNKGFYLDERVPLVLERFQ